MDWLEHLKYSIAKSIRVIADIVIIFALWNFSGVGWFLILAKLSEYFPMNQGFCCDVCMCGMWLLLHGYLIGAFMIGILLHLKHRRNSYSKRKNEQ